MKNNFDLMVVVENGHWDAYGEPTFRNRVLTKCLQRKGINESVSDGTYTYSLRRAGLHFVESLIKA